MERRQSGVSGEDLEKRSLERASSRRVPSWRVSKESRETLLCVCGLFRLFGRARDAVTTARGGRRRAARPLGGASRRRVFLLLSAALGFFKFDVRCFEKG